MAYFPDIDKIPFEGPESTNPLAYRYYDKKRKVAGKTMEEYLRIAVCFWHTFCWEGEDQFGAQVFKRPWLQNPDPMKLAFERVEAGFEFMEKLGTKYYAFHNLDVAPEGDSIDESNANLSNVAERLGQEMERTGMELLWGTTNLTRNPRYMSGAATNPDPDVFAYAAAQVKHTFDITHELGGHNYVLWGGREGYETMLNTCMKREQAQYARFLSMLADYKHKIGFKGQLLIEPKPCEPSKHQYDFDSATVFAFLQKHGLEKEYKLNIEGNHATLAGHTFAHEIGYAYVNDMFGSIDVNAGDLLLGWDTDQFAVDPAEMRYILFMMLQFDGFAGGGGFNLDTKVRRQSTELVDLFYGHISGIDTLAKALLEADEMLREGTLSDFVKERYSGWESDIGKKILKGASLEEIASYTAQKNLQPEPRSGHQEYLERILFDR